MTPARRGSRPGDGNGPNPDEIRAIVSEVLAELRGSPGSGTDGSAGGYPTVGGDGRHRPGTRDNDAAHATRQDIDLPDPTPRELRRTVGVAQPANPTGLQNLVSSTTARIGVGRAGPRPRTSSLLLFRADHAVTQDAIFGEVPEDLLARFGMFTVQSRVTDPEEYLLRPDLGRQLSDAGRAEVEARCTKSPQVQVVVGDGLSWAAVANNLPKIYPVVEQGLKSAKLTVGTPFFVRYCRVGVMNDINDIVGADVVVLLIGERPGLGVADALSVYSGWRPASGKTDAHRDVICMITENGGTNPLEAGAYVVQHVRTVLANQASGVDLRLKLSGSGTGG